MAKTRAQISALVLVSFFSVWGGKGHRNLCAASSHSSSDFVELKLYNGQSFSSYLGEMKRYGDKDSISDIDKVVHDSNADHRYLVNNERQPHCLMTVSNVSNKMMKIYRRQEANVSKKTKKMKKDSDTWLADISPFAEVVIRAQCRHIICVGTETEVKICKAAEEAVGKQTFNPFGTAISMYNPMRDQTGSDFFGGLQALDPFEAEKAVNAIQSENTAVQYRRLTGRHYVGAVTLGFADSILPFHMWSGEEATQENILLARSQPLLSQDDERKAKEYYCGGDYVPEDEYQLSLSAVSSDARIFRIPHFVSDYESRSLIALAQEKMNVQSFKSTQEDSSIDHFAKITLDSNDSPVVRHLMQRSLELLSLWGQDAYYDATEFDFLGSVRIEHQKGSKEQSARMQLQGSETDIVPEEEYGRFATIHLLLDGGNDKTHLAFPAGLDVAVNKHDATLVYGMFPDGNLDLRSVFRQSPLAEDEERWIATVIVSSKAAEELGDVKRQF